MKTKAYCGIVLSFFICTISFSQKTHKVSAKETLYSISRQYQVNAKELADFNKLDINKGLTIGQVIKIPTGKNSVVVDNKKKPVSNAPKPIYHIVKKQENLFKIRIQYNKVPMDSLKKWNKLTSDNVKEGMKLIVGFEGMKIPVDDKKNEVVKKADDSVSNQIKPDSAITIINSPNIVVMDSIKVDSSLIVNADTNSKNSISSDSSLISSLTYKSDSIAKKDDSEGFFKEAYHPVSTEKTELGLAAVFKSTSGWEDKRYYCLHNTITPGSIIKVTNKANQKSAYAKVLDAMPDLETNKDLIIRISKAMAETIGIVDEKSEVIVSY